MSTDSDIPSAANRVLHIFELLEAILLDVDERTLLVSAQRVNKRWWNVIGNPNFQKRLFFVPDHGALGSTVNPLLLEYFKFCLPTCSIFDNTNWKGTFIFKDRTPTDKEVTGRVPRNLNPNDVVTIKHKAEAFSRAEASWRRMLTHQPPKVGVHQDFSGSVDPSFRLGVECPRGNYQNSYQEQHVGKVVRMSTVVEYFFRPDKAVDHRLPQEFPPRLKRVVRVTHIDNSDNFWWWRMYQPKGPHGQVFFQYYVVPELSDGPCPMFGSLEQILLPHRSLIASCVWYWKSKVERWLQLAADFLKLKQDFIVSINRRPSRRLYKHFQNSDVERGLRRLRNFFGLETRADDED